MTPKHLWNDEKDAFIIFFATLVLSVFTKVQLGYPGPVEDALKIYVHPSGVCAPSNGPGYVLVHNLGVAGL